MKMIEVLKRLQPYKQFNYYKDGKEFIFIAPSRWAKNNVKRVGYTSLKFLIKHGDSECLERFAKMAIKDEVGGYL